MIILRKMQLVLLAVVIGLAAVFISLGLLGMTSSVLAQGQEHAEPMKLAPRTLPSFNIVAYVVFTDPAITEITDLSGNVVGDGRHLGRVRCNGNHCSRKTRLRFTSPSLDAVFEYRFMTGQALDPDEEILVVAGRGNAIFADGTRERFSFTAIFQNNGDGTVSATYHASRPDASFVIPSSAAAFRIFTGP